MNFLLAADPGTQGALCLLSVSGKKIKFLDTPQSKNLTATVRALQEWLYPARDHVALVAIEDVHSMANMSAKSNFQFGRNLGLVECLLHYHFPQVEYIQPKAWQKACEIFFEYPKGATKAQKAKIRKQTTADRASELYPKALLYGPRGGLLDGRADSLMIAHTLRIKYGELNEIT